MIQLREHELPHLAASTLEALQAEINAISDYAAQVQAAAKRFKSATASPAFDAVRETLAAMSAGNSRCGFCEDSAANEIEHVRPKALYPDAVFVWPNYVYACGACNKSKGSRFAVLATSSQSLVDVSRRRGALIVPPIAGAAALIDPRREDASRYLGLDLIDSFYFYPLAHSGTLERVRAQYTIDLLKLNARDPLVRQRRQFFEIYAGQLKAYLHDKTRGATDADLLDRRELVLSLGHPTVWLEMRRQHGRHPQLRTLFAALPEALLWDSAATASRRWM